jgi:hypothetical protein
MDILLMIYLGVNVIGLVICLIGLESGYTFWNGVFNPKAIYKSMKVNWFGAYLLATVAFICMTPAAIIYWFYKLCTVGRR